MTAAQSTTGSQRRRDRAILHCGWGRLLFAQTFDEPAELAAALASEQAGQRDIAIYVKQPQLVLAHAPQALFLDPSILFRLQLHTTLPRHDNELPFSIRPLLTRSDIGAMNRLYAARGMVKMDTASAWADRDNPALLHLLAEDKHSGDIIGCILGVDHVEAWGDPDGGSSFWCLAVDPQCPHPGVGQALVLAIAEQFQHRERRHLDLSVMHDNHSAITLYEKLGFVRTNGFAIKHKNAINEPLFCSAERFDGLNPYARIIVNEALRRGIAVELLDIERNLFQLSWGGREFWCRESLSDLTSALTYQICQDKALTLRLLSEAGLRVPAQTIAGDAAHNQAFLRQHDVIVVKPHDGEQGRGISVGIRDPESMAAAISRARAFSDTVLLEQFCPGEDLRIIVIGYAVVAAAVRKPAQIVGDGQLTVQVFLQTHRRRRLAATGGESQIPLDAETERCLALQGLRYDSVLPLGAAVSVRKTANLHTGGTIHDVTAELHPALREAAVLAARTLRIPVVGFDFLVPRVDGAEYVIIEANERPGLANHEPQPTAERFIDLLFPATA
ncbi:MAG: N-acetylglutaminylglutamine synthetase [Permianibacter sp.]